MYFTLKISRHIVYLYLSILYYIYFILLYCKDREQLKTFLTPIGAAVPLRLDPPVGVESDRREDRCIEIAYSRTFVLKCIFVLTRVRIALHSPPLHRPPLSSRVRPSRRRTPPSGVSPLRHRPTPAPRAPGIAYNG